MGAVKLIKSIPHLSERAKASLQSKGIHRLEDLNERSVAEVWALVIIPYQKPFTQLISAMKAAKVSFRDCDPRKVNLVADDLDKLQLSTGLRNTLIRNEMKSIELMRRVGARQLQDAARLIGPESIIQLRAALKKIGLELPD